MKYEDLVKGKDYYYWSKSIHESKPSKKLCKLEWFNRKFARVSRYDLDLNSIQTINISRLISIESDIAKEVGI